MVKGLISVVVPVYNVEKHLDRCVESIVTQTYKNIEIILVDDGSTDSCPQKCDDWKEKDSRIKVIHKVNAGLGMARNTGIENAGGQYIFFFDSDDYVDTEAVEVLYAEASSTEADLVLFGYRCVSADGGIIKTTIPNTGKSFFSGAEVTELILPALFGPDPVSGRSYGLEKSAWSCMYSAELISKTGWRFVSEREYISEDIYSNLDLYAHVNSVSVVSRAFYFYCRNNSSLTSSFREDRFSKNLYLYDGCIRLIEKHSYPEIIRSQIANSVLSNIIGALKTITACDKPFETKLDYVREIVVSPKFQLILRQANKKGYSPMLRILTAVMGKRLSYTTYLIVYAFEKAQRLRRLK